MAELGEAFNTLQFPKKSCNKIDYFFAQRTLTEERSYIDKKMNHKTKKVKVTHNFLTLNIPTITIQNNGNNNEKPLGFDIEIYGDEGYNYKGSITSYKGCVPSFSISIENDKEFFVNINYKFTENESTQTKNFTNFIKVPKRFQSIGDSDIIDEDDNNDENE